MRKEFILIMTMILLTSCAATKTNYPKDNVSEANGSSEMSTTVEALYKSQVDNSIRAILREGDFAIPDHGTENITGVVGSDAGQLLVAFDVEEKPDMPVQNVITTMYEIRMSLSYKKGDRTTPVKFSQVDESKFNEMLSAIQRRVETKVEVKLSTLDENPPNKGNGAVQWNQAADTALSIIGIALDIGVSVMSGTMTDGEITKALTD
ncbi:hypothetical protein [Desulfohalovibrio reitneri]|uniref:hypothetical protein n=1 Tax=Desulfohalovibrio reitneri TaxID=1307759 RepID=UPI0004A6F009|nr:hypothetical protein [Desulfohalovibrio reitneri]